MLSKYFKNLSIRYKLSLFLIIPIFTILYFSISGINARYEEQQEGNKSLEFILISFQIDDLVHELQKERGISAGFVGSGGKLLRDELLIQRKRTDEKLEAYSLGLITSGAKKNYWGFPEVHSRSKLNQKMVTAIRNSVDSLNRTNFFEKYSEVISTGIDIINNLPAITSGAIVTRQSSAYTNLLLLQERSGQERGMLNGVFTSGKLDAIRFKLITRYIADQEALLKKFYTEASKKQQKLLREKMQSQEISDVLKLRTAAIHKATRNDLLNSLQSLIGYGGLIHHFKNYVIRGNKIHADKFNTIYFDAVRIINEYQKLPGISNKEIISLNTVKDTFNKYKNLLATTRSLRDKGRSTQEIDSIVKIDDRPALEEIDYLHLTVTGLDTSIWWEKASLRIDLMRDVSYRVRGDILTRAKQQLSSTTDSMVLYFALTIMSLSLSFTLGYSLIRYILGSIINIANDMNTMQQKGEFEKLLNIDSTDEISQVAKAFNNLINERSKFDEQQRLAATVFEKTSEAMVVTDADNKFIMVNPAFTMITGYTFEEVVGKNPSILQSDKQDGGFYKNLWSSLHKHGSWTGEITNRRKNGELYPEWLNINVIKDKGGKIIKYVAMFSDITERKQHEEKQVVLQRQLLHAHKMESLGQLTGGIAHDFNNMLSAILGYTSLALELDNDKNKRDDFLNEVIKAGNRAKDLVIQMLAFSRDNKDIEFQVVDIEPLLKESLNMIRPMMPTSIEFVYHISAYIAPIMANPVMINQVVMNLCINARDAIGEHGRIEFTIHQVSIDNEVCSSCHMPLSGDFIEVSINDTGAGVEAGIINHLFDPFFTTKEMGSEKGTGMGLAMVHGILHDHNGHIIVESIPGKGSNFRLLFPLISETDVNLIAKATTTENVDLLQTASSNENYNILLVDDEKSIVMLMKEVLENKDFQVTTFTDSELALTHFKENYNKYDLVITDQTMPRFTGVELSKAIFKIKPELPIILCSGYSDSVNNEKSKSIGIKAFMTKPINMQDLFSTIKQLLD